MTLRRLHFRQSGRPSSFTLVELLVVIAIISILAALTLYAGSAVMQKGMRSRAAAEIQAISTAVESYKTDNGIYPQSDGALLLTNTPYSSIDVSTAPAAYTSNSTLLYIALSGQNYFGATPVSGTKVYMNFKANQIGNSGGPYSYIQDPWTYSYGYSTGTKAGAATTNYPYNGSGFFDLWSTAGKKGTTAANTNSWISNWQ